MSEESLNLGNTQPDTWTVLVNKTVCSLIQTTRSQHAIGGQGRNRESCLSRRESATLILNFVCTIFRCHHKQIAGKPRKCIRAKKQKKNYPNIYYSLKAQQQQNEAKLPFLPLRLSTAKISNISPGQNQRQLLPTKPPIATPQSPTTIWCATTQAMPLS